MGGSDGRLQRDGWQGREHYFPVLRPDGADTLDEKHRFQGASFSDFETRYTGLSCVNLADQTTKYYYVENDDVLVYNLGTNPLMQYGVDETKDALRTNVLTAL